MEEAKLELSGAQYDYEQFILNSYIDSQSWEGGGEIPLLLSLPFPLTGTQRHSSQRAVISPDMILKLLLREL